MTPDERDLRRALNARSGELTPAFRATLSGVLAEGRPSGNLRPALAVVGSVILVVGTIAILLVSRHGGVPAGSHNPVNPPAVATPSPVPTATSTIAPAPTPNLSTAPITLPTDAQFSAPSSSIVWALVANSLLFRSADSGGTWQQRSLPPSVADLAEISFVDDHQGWALGRGSPATQCQSESATIWHTADAGGTWQRLNGSGIAGARCKEALSFVDAMHGFLAAWDDNDAPVIYRTADGGRTWVASRGLPDPPGFTTQRGGVTLRPNRVYASGSTLLVAAQGASGPYVYRSTDGGATWTYLASAPDSASSIAFVTGSRWLELIVPGQSKETLDAGATWHASTSDYSQAAPVAPVVVFGGPEVGYATVRGGLQRTLDGGLHWSILRTPGTG